MSSTIKEFSQIREQELLGLKNQAARERRALEEIHQKNKASVKQAQEQEIVELKNDHAQSIDEATSHKEKVLNDLEKSLTQTKDFTQKRLESLKSSATAQEDKIHADHAEKRLLLNANNEQHLTEANHRFNSQLKKINAEGESRIETSKNELGQRKNDIEKNYQNKIQVAENHHRNILSQNETTFKQLNEQKNAEYELKEKNQREDHESKIIAQTETHQNLYTARNEDYRKKFHEQQNFFEKKFENQLGTHHTQLSGLDKKYESITNNLKKNFVKEISAQEDKKDDIFFEFTELKAQMKEGDDHYLVEVEVPSYAKNDLRLTTNNKEVVLTLNRRYQDQLENNGRTSKINKIETLSSRMPTNHFLNAKKITSTYADGVMTYKIAKA